MHKKRSAIDVLSQVSKVVNEEAMKVDWRKVAKNIARKVSKDHPNPELRKVMGEVLEDMDKEERTVE